MKVLERLANGIDRLLGTPPIKPEYDFVLDEHGGVTVDLAKLTPEERSRLHSELEAMRQKFFPQMAHRGAQ